MPFNKHDGGLQQCGDISIVIQSIDAIKCAIKSVLIDEWILNQNANGIIYYSKCEANLV